jgi:hypothetical protein
LGSPAGSGDGSFNQLFCASFGSWTEEVAVSISRPQLIQSLARPGGNVTGPESLQLGGGAMRCDPNAQSAENHKSVMAVTAAQSGACHICLRHLGKRSKYMTTVTNTGRTSEQVHKSADGVLTEAELHQVTGGITPSIPIPPPTPHTYARGAANSTMQSDVNPQ